MLQGGFRLWAKGKELFVPNLITNEGVVAYLKMIGRDTQTDIASGGDFYLGLCGNVNDPTATLASLTGEPAVANGYSRKAITRDAAGWPTLDTLNGVNRICTAIKSFTASGGDFSAAFRRAFLCNVSAGSSGLLLGISGPLEATLLIEDGETVDMRYELYLR